MKCIIYIDSEVLTNQNQKSLKLCVINNFYLFLICYICIYNLLPYGTIRTFDKSNHIALII